MVLGVKRHVPHQQPHCCVGQRGARVGQSVTIRRAPGVFRQYLRAQERLAEKLRQYPIDKRNLPAEGSADATDPPTIATLMAFTLRIIAGAACSDTDG